MDRVRLLTHKGRSIIYSDFSLLGISKKDEFYETIKKSKELISKQLTGSALVITNVAKAGFDIEMVKDFKEYANQNTPYIKSSAIVGLSGMQKAILLTIKSLTKREFALFDTLDTALEWISGQ